LGSGDALGHNSVSRGRASLGVLDRDRCSATGIVKDWNIAKHIVRRKWPVVETEGVIWGTSAGNSAGSEGAAAGARGFLEGGECNLHGVRKSERACQSFIAISTDSVGDLAEHDEIVLIDGEGDDSTTFAGGYRAAELVAIGVFEREGFRV